MITALSCIVHMPPGHYDKIAQVIRHMVSHRSGIRWGTGKYRKPRKRTRPYQTPKPKRNAVLADEWKREMREQDPDGLQELWLR